MKSILITFAELIRGSTRLVKSIWQTIIISGSAQLPKVDRPTVNDRFSLQPWRFSKHAQVWERVAQKQHQALLQKGGNVRIGHDVYISPEADLSIGDVEIGDYSAVGGSCQVGIDVKIGRNCTINPGSVVRGKVRIGDDVRIASGSQILGFNHGWQDLERPIWQQTLSSTGIEIGDDCWIGANAVVLDGVRIGAHAIVGAGSVVTKEVPAWMIVAGNPARTLQSRKYGRAQARKDLKSQWERFVNTVCEEMPSVLARSFSGEHYFDFPGDKAKVRPLADAVELASMAGCDVPGFPRPKLVELLSSWQDQKTGLVFGPFGEEVFSPDPSRASDLEYRGAAYGVLAVGYALECLEAGLPYPVSVAHEMSAPKLEAKLNSLRWNDRAWQCGAWIDHFATACYFNSRHHRLERDLSDLQSWLKRNVNAETGLWGDCAPARDFLHPVNGFYRLTRGAHAQFNWDLGYPKQVIDSVLEHAHDPRHLSEDTATACNVLDVIHPLLLCGRQTNHRRDEVLAVAEFWLQRTIAHWRTGKGMRFTLAESSLERLQGTEMWIAIAWHCAYALNLATTFDAFRPKGIHRF